MNIDVREMGLRVLGEFDDKDMENVFSTLNAVVYATGDPAELATFCASLNILVMDGFIVLGFEKESFIPETVLDKVASLDLVTRLPDWFRFDQEEKIWTLGRGTFRTDAIPFVMLTDAGRGEALEVRKAFGVSLVEEVRLRELCVRFERSDYLLSGK